MNINLLTAGSTFMSTLFNKQTQETVILRTNHTFGRNSESNTTTLQSPCASRNHAAIAWDGETWKIKDISSNGTYIDKNRISPRKYHLLPNNALIQFGDMTTETWEVLNLDPPVTGLIPVTTPGEIIPLHDVFILPVAQPEIMIYLSEDSQWLCEVGGEPSVLYSGDKIGAKGHYWYFVDGRPSAATATMITPPPNDIQFQFMANQNEEHVSLKLVAESKTIDLGERNHHYLLLLLAKQRHADIEKKYPESEQGWIKKDLLVQMMGIAEQHINIQIHRFRKQVANDLPQPYRLHQIIERRPGELRFAYCDISIEGGFKLSSQTV